MVSLWCELLCKRPSFTLKSDQWITTRWAKFDLECLLQGFSIIFSCRPQRVKASSKIDVWGPNDHHCAMYFYVCWSWQRAKQVWSAGRIWSTGRHLRRPGLLLISIDSNSKFKVICKNGDFECRYIRTHSEETKPSKLSNITFAILIFFFSSKYIAILSTLESTSLNETITCASKWFILTQHKECKI